MVVRHIRAVLGAAAGAALVIGMGVAPVAAATPGGAGGGGSVAGTVFPGVLFGASTLSAADAWAAGSYHNNTTGADNTLILHWNGTAWSQVPSPNPGRREALYSVNAASAADAWAVGDIGNAQCFSAVTMILHWNGAAWSRVTSPNPGPACNFLNSVSALSATSAWAAGSYCKFAVNTCPPTDPALERYILVPGAHPHPRNGVV